MSLYVAKTSSPVVEAWLDVKNCYASKPLLVGAMLLDGGFFFRAGSPFEQHPLALTGVREIFLALCFLFAVIAFLEGLRKRQLFIGDALILFLGLAFPIVSAIFSHLRSQQPVLFGLLEERRVFAIFAVFFIMLCYQFSKASPDHLIGAIYLTALIYLVIGLILQTGIMGDLAARDVPALDPRKHRILVGTELYTSSVVIAAVMVIYHKAWRHMVPVLVGLAGLMLVSQTRGAIAVSVLTIVVLFALRYFAIAFAMASIFIGVGLLWTSSGMNFSDYVQAGEIQVRLNTINAVIDALKANDWVGLGSLSLQWEDGFALIYGKHFFLSDVGIIGELYRLGAVLVVICLIMGLAVYFYVKSCPDERGRSICYSLIILNILFLPEAGFIAFAGFQWSLVFAVAGAFRLGPRTSDRTLAAWPPGSSGGRFLHALPGPPSTLTQNARVAP